MPIHEPEEIVISKDIAEKIAKTVNRYRNSNRHLMGRRHCLSTCVDRKKNWTTGCHCPLISEERKMRSWIEELHCHNDALFSHSGCCCWTSPHSDTMELGKTVLLYGEMEPLLRIASHPAIDLKDKWMFVFDCNNDLGVSELMRSTLMSYITLKVIYLHPELWDENTKGDWTAARRCVMGSGGLNNDLVEFTTKQLRVEKRQIGICHM